MLERLCKMERRSVMEKIHIEKGSVQEKLIVPLYARKLCAEQFPSLYQDGYSAIIWRKCILTG